MHKYSQLDLTDSTDHPLSRSRWRFAKLLLVSFVLMTTSYVSAAVSLLSSGADGAFNAAENPFPAHESGRYDFTSFTVAGGSVLDVSTSTPQAWILILADGPLSITGALLAPGKNLILASTDHVTLAGTVIANILGIFSNDYALGEDLHLELNGLVLGGFEPLFDVNVGGSSNLVLQPGVLDPPISFDQGAIMLIHSGGELVTRDVPGAGGPFIVTSPSVGGPDYPGSIILGTAGESGGIIPTGGMVPVGGIVFIGESITTPLPASGWLLMMAVAGTLVRRTVKP